MNDCCQAYSSQHDTHDGGFSGQGGPPGILRRTSEADEEHQKALAKPAVIDLISDDDVGGQVN